MTEAVSPHAIAEWVPFAKAAGFFFATVIFEDVPAIGAGLLVASGEMSWLAAFVSCFLGIWLGDTSLYGFARFSGRSWFEKSSLHRFAPKVARSERWFAKRGAPILIFSRMVPGARLPTYFAAGFLRLPVPRFLLVTGAASFGWTWIVLILARTFGGQMVHWLNACKHAGLLLIAIAVAIFAVLRLIRIVARRRAGCSRLDRPAQLGG